MPTKRTPLRRDMRVRITPRVIELWRQCREIQDAGSDKAWEDEGGRRREFFDAQVELDGLLGLGPWQESPLGVDEGDPPEWMTDQARRADWRNAQNLRRKIMEQIGE